jgi:hypothetical protein
MTDLLRVSRECAKRRRRKGEGRLMPIDAIEHLGVVFVALIIAVVVIWKMR